MTGQIQLIVIHGNPLQASRMLQSLKARDYFITYASSGAEGMRQAKKTKPDVILIDATLPDAGGPEICRQIKSEPSLLKCIVILLDFAMILNDGQSAGLDDVIDSRIAGPVSNLELAARIQDIIQIKSAQDALKACEERFRLLYEKSPVPYLTLNENRLALRRRKRRRKVRRSGKASPPAQRTG